MNDRAIRHGSIVKGHDISALENFGARLIAEGRHLPPGATDIDQRLRKRILEQPMNLNKSGAAAAQTTDQGGVAAMNEAKRVMKERAESAITCHERLAVYERVTWECPRCGVSNQSGPDTVMGDVVDCRACKNKFAVAARYR